MRPSLLRARGRRRPTRIAVSAMKPRAPRAPRASFCGDAGVELLPDARDAEEDGRLHLLEVLRHLLDGLGEVDLRSPAVMGPWMVKTCSAMCESGRYESAASVRGRPRASARRFAVHARFSCESMTPLGGPVVPEV